MTKEIITIDTSSEGDFRTQANDYLSKGGIVLSSSCGIVDSEAYDYQDYWKAIMLITGE